MLLVDQQGATVSRARTADDIVDAVAALAAGFAPGETGAKFGARTVRRPDGSLAIVEPWPGRVLAGLTPRLVKAGFEPLAPIEFGIRSDGQLDLGEELEPGSAHSMVLLSADVPDDHHLYLAAARITQSLITNVAAEHRPETLARVATLAESLTSVETIEGYDPAPIFEAVTR